MSKEVSKKTKWISGSVIAVAVVIIAIFGVIALFGEKSSSKEAPAVASGSAASEEASATSPAVASTSVVINTEFRRGCGKTTTVADCRTPTLTEVKDCQADESGYLCCPPNTLPDDQVELEKRVGRGELNLCACTFKDTCD